jgi:predicted phage baseplate assembly protein
MISALNHGFDPQLPGDQTHTTLLLATPTAYQYKRDTLTIYGNVVKATHGETRNEILGSGDGAQRLQSFTLKQPPLTFVAAPTAAGAESTLHVYVDNVEWHEADSLAGLGPRDHRFVTATDDASNTRLTFGNGVEGARLPTGVQNVKAIYRNGIGTGGNVKAEQVSLLQTRPLGVTAVINPLRASGGADKEPRDLARENVPLSVMPLDRLVSVADYADFARNFAGIAKAIARRASDGRRQLLHLTIAGADDIPIDPSSDLYRNLLAAFRKLGDRDVPVQVDQRELTALVLSAGVKLLPDYLWEPVVSAIRARLLDAFGFGKRSVSPPCAVRSST